MIEKITKNNLGRDFVIGDVHAQKALLLDALASVNFDETKDRLFFIGDLIDRGQEPLFILDWLKKPCAFSIIGNHEVLIFNRFKYPAGQKQNDAIKLHQRNGGEWFSRLPYEQQEAIYHDLKALPYVITLETEKGNIGLVHSEVPDYLNSWNELLEGLDENDEKLIEDMIWNRDAIAEFYDYHRYRKWEEGVPVADRWIEDISLTVHGHTGVHEPQVHCNQVWIDTGHVIGSLTILEVGELLDLVESANG